MTFRTLVPLTSGLIAWFAMAAVRLPALVGDHRVLQRDQPLTVKNCPAAQPQPAVEGSNWQVCRPQPAGRFSAVAYFFARDLHQRCHVPIGIVGSPWGGTPAEAWVGGTALQHLPEVG